MWKYFCLGLFMALVTPAFAAAANSDNTAGGPDTVVGWNLQFSLYTRHWDPDPEHNNHQKMIDAEVRFRGNWLVGLSLFDNSFYQPTQLVYAGKTWPLLDSRHWYLKLVGGLIHGYEEPYEDKIPFNGLGVAPLIMPSLGYRHGHLMVEAHFAGVAAMTVTAGLRF